MPLYRASGFFGEFAFRRCQRILIFDDALGKRPDVFVSTLPEGSAGMDNEEFELTRSSSKEQDPGAARGHQ